MAGCVGGSARRPKSLGVDTNGRSKWCIQMRLTITRAVSGLSLLAMAWANSRRPLPCVNGRRSPSESTHSSRRGTRSPRRLGLPRLKITGSTGLSRSTRTIARIGAPGWPNDWIADWWVYRVGVQRAKLLNFTAGSALSGLEAVEWGFAVRAFPADRLDAETRRLAEWIAKTPLQVLRLKKLAINQAEDQMGFRTVARYTAGQNIIISRSEGGRAGGRFVRSEGFAAAREQFGPPKD